MILGGNTIHCGEGFISELEAKPSVENGKTDIRSKQAFEHLSWEIRRSDSVELTLSSDWTTVLFVEICRSD